MKTPVFPPNCRVQNGEITLRRGDYDVFSCNFWPQVLSVTADSVDNTGNPRVAFQLCIDGGGYGLRRELQLSDLKRTDFEALDIRCRSSGDTRRLPDLMYQIARSQIEETDVSIVPRFRQTGWAELNAQHVYVAGNQVIGPQGWVDARSYSLDESLTHLTLELDARITESEAARYVCNLCRLHPGVSNVLVAATVAGHLFSLFADAGITPRLTAYVVGPSMVKKTTLAQLICATYNRSSTDCPHLVNLLSTTAAVHSRVASLDDCCTIVDDLNVSESRAEMRHREERISEIIRTAGNGAGKEHMGGKNSITQLPRGVVVATAEYTLQAYSTMARCVVLHLDVPVSNERLTPLQRKPKALSSFWFYFLAWCSKRYDNIVRYLKSKVAKMRQNPTMFQGMERMDETYLVLEAAMKLVARYMQNLNDEHEQSSTKMVDTFLVSIGKVQTRQAAELKRMRSAGDQNRFSKMLAQLYSGGQLDLPKKKHLGPGCEGAASKRLLYLTMGYLEKVARRHFDDSSITDRAITAELRRNGLLEMDSSNASTKKVNGVRYLQVPLSRLSAYRGRQAEHCDDRELVDIIHGR